MTTSFSYIHCTPDGTPFYVGKGTRRRITYFSGRNAQHQSIVAEYGKLSILHGFFECSSVAIAYELERGLIKCLKRAGIALCNRTAGGEGGRDPVESTRRRLSAAAKARGISAVCRAANIAARKGKPLSAELCAKVSAGNKGKVFTDAHRKNISISAKKRGMSQACRDAAKKVGSWGTTRLPRPVYVDGVLFLSFKAATAAVGLSHGAILYALKHSGVVKGRRVWEPKL